MSVCYWVTLCHTCNILLYIHAYTGVAMDTEPYEVVAGLLIRKAVT